VSKARRALTPFTILLLAAALLTTLVARGTHAPSITRAAPAATGAHAADTDGDGDDVTPTNTPLPADTLSNTSVPTATSTNTPAEPTTPTADPQTTASTSDPHTTTPTASTSTTATTANTTSVQAAPSGDHAIKTVFLIAMENQNWSSIKGSSSAPYINNTLLPMASHAEQYYNPSGNHPSLPNYLWLEAGTNFGITDDNAPSSHPLNTTSHLVTLLNNAGISWKAYEESSSGTRCPLTDSYPYAVKHDPFVYFDDVTNNLSSSSATCLAHVRPYGELTTDLQNNTVARYNFITPNLCDDMHDSCSPTNDAIKQGDNWLKNNMPAILNSQAYKNGGALFITWDEGESGSDGPIGLIVLSPYAKGNGYSNTIHYTHSSMLRTLQEIFGVSPYLGDAANATDLGDLFTTFP
jgi:hypothetical protein